MIDKLKKDVPNLVKLMDNQNLNEYIKSVVSYSFDANKYFNDLEPWSVKKKDPERMQAILFTASEQIKNISILLNAIIPSSTEKVFKTLNINKKDITINQINSLDTFDHNKELKELDILFNKIENDN